MSEPQHSASEDTRGRTIYVLSGDERLRESLRGELAELGYPVRLHASAQEILAEVSFAAIGCVLFEFQPASASATVAALTHAAPALALIAVAESPATHAVVALMRAGVVNVLDQPVARERLHDAVHDALTVSERRAGDLAERRAAAERASRLTAEQAEVLRHALNGVPNKSIAAELGMSLRKVERLRAAAFQTLGVTTLAEAAKILHLVKAGVDSA